MARKSSVSSPNSSVLVYTNRKTSNSVLKVGERLMPMKFSLNPPPHTRVTRHTFLKYLVVGEPYTSPNTGANFTNIFRSVSRKSLSTLTTPSSPTYAPTDGLNHGRNTLSKWLTSVDTLCYTQTFPAPCLYPRITLKSDRT